MTEIEFTEEWDIVECYGPRVAIGGRLSSPIIGPDNTMAALMRGTVSLPARIDVMSGKTYVMHGPQVCGCTGEKSLVGRDRPQSAWARFVAWVGMKTGEGG